MSCFERGREKERESVVVKRWTWKLEVSRAVCFKYLRPQITAATENTSVFSRQTLGEKKKYSQGKLPRNYLFLFYSLFAKTKERERKVKRKEAKQSKLWAMYSLGTYENGLHTIRLASELCINPAISKKSRLTARHNILLIQKELKHKWQLPGS